MRQPKSNQELSEEIKALQRAIAEERGENHRLREEIRAFLERGHW
jgi:hypothetical protein